MNLRPKMLSIYIIKEIFKNFFIIFTLLLLLFFAIDFFEVSKDSKNIKNALTISVQIVLFRIPNFLETILHFIILLAGLFSFYKFSNNSEIAIIRTSGRSIFHIIKFPIFIAFLFGIFVITIYNPISSWLNVKSESLRNIHFKNEREDYLEPNNGIWFKQKNLDNNKEEFIIIKSSKVYKDLLIFDGVILLYIDFNNKFIKRINTKILKLNDNNTWTATNNYIIREGQPNEYIDKIIIPTSLTKNFILKSIQNDYDSLYNISFWNLNSSIKNLKELGFNTLKFEVRYYYLMTVPFLFAIMIVISAYFGIVNTRNKKKYLSIIKGITAGFIIFISHNIITELTNAERLTVLDGSVFIILLYILFSLTLIIKKDLINNYDHKKHY